MKVKIHSKKMNSEEFKKVMSEAIDKMQGVLNEKIIEEKTAEMLKNEAESKPLTFTEVAPKPVFPIEIDYTPYKVIVDKSPANWCGNGEPKDVAYSAKIIYTPNGEMIASACTCTKSAHYKNTFTYEDNEAYALFQSISHSLEAYKNVASLFKPQYDNMYTFKPNYDAYASSVIEAGYDLGYVGDTLTDIYGDCQMAMIVASLAICRHTLNKVGFLNAFYATGVTEMPITLGMIRSVTNTLISIFSSEETEEYYESIIDSICNAYSDYDYDYDDECCCDCDDCCDNCCDHSDPEISKEDVYKYFAQKLKA